MLEDLADTFMVVVLIVLVLYFLKLTGLLALIGIDPETDLLLWLAGIAITALLASQAIIYQLLSSNSKQNTTDIGAIKTDISNIRERLVKIETKLE
jgi:uncharacterized membrane protein YqjE